MTDPRQTDRFVYAVLASAGLLLALTMSSRLHAAGNPAAGPAVDAVMKNPVVTRLKAALTTP